MLSRRKFMQGTAILAASPVLPGLPSLALAAAAKAPRPSQVPGYYRLNLGEIEVTALYDGATKLKPEILHGAGPKELDALFEDSCIDPANGLPIAVNAFLLNTGANLALVDTGAGNYFGDKAGKLVQNLKAAGYEPEQIDTLLLTHMHSDHALGLVDAAGQPIFAKAKLRVCKDEADYWLSDDLLAKTPEERKPFILKLRAAIAPYATTGRLQPFAPGESPLPGVAAVPLGGHTPGHSGFQVSSQGQSLLVWGDIVHNAATQFPRPEITIDFDVDQSAAQAARARLLAKLAKERTWIAGAHLPFPGLGRVRPRAKGYAFVPVEYAELDLDKS